MNDKQARFVQEYLIDLNATQAAIRAGYSEKTAGEMGYENLNKPHIMEAVQKAQAERAYKTGIDAEWVLKEA
ncbi:MAG: terminase small subunit, partial [Shewanella sp.]